MDYEKKYKEALEKARQLCAYPTTKPFISDLQDLFPELVESEDEKVRKELIDAVQGLWDNDALPMPLSVKRKDEWLAWLEKQKEYESTDFEYVWDRTDCGELTSALDKYSEEAIINMCHAWYDKGIELERKSWLEKQGEKHPDPYNGISFEYNGHIWGMCARDGGVDISCDKHLIKHLDEQGEKLPVGFYYVNSEGKKFYSDTFKYGDVILHVEKQGEQKSQRTISAEAKEALFDYENANIKQKDFAPKDEPKFKIGDWVVNKLGNVWHIDSFDKENYQVSNGNGYNYFPISKQNEMRLWTIQDAKDGDVLLFEGYYNAIVLFQGIGINGAGHINYHCKCDLGNYSFNIQGDVAYLGTIEKNAECFHPATKEQREQLEKAMADAGYTFDFENKELKKIEQKPEGNKGNVGGISDNPEWSEEDEHRLNSCLNILQPKTFVGNTETINTKWLKSLKGRVKPQPKQEWSEEEIEPIISDYLCGREHYGGMIGRLCHLKPKQKQTEWGEDDEAFLDDILCKLEHDLILNKDEKDWLKSLKGRVQLQNKWKPSDEQMECLSDAIKHYNSLGYPASKLKELLDDLKKLKGKV